MQCDALSTLSPATYSIIIYFITLARPTYLNIVADQLDHFLATKFPYGSGLFHQDNSSWHTAKMIQEWFEEQGVDLASKISIQLSMYKTSLIHGGSTLET